MDCAQNQEIYLLSSTEAVWREEAEWGKEFWQKGSKPKYQPPYFQNAFAEVLLLICFLVRNKTIKNLKLFMNYNKTSKMANAVSWADKELSARAEKSKKKKKKAPGWCFPSSEPLSKET